MKKNTAKNWLSRVSALSLATILAAPAIQIPANAANSNTNFNQSLAELISQQDDSHYFDAMELPIGSHTLTIDGEAQEMDAAAVLKNKRTMLPIRAIAEAAGAQVSYDKTIGGVVIVGAHGDKIACPTGSTSMQVNGETRTLDVPSYVQNGRTYMPVRAVAEALNLTAEWDKEIQGVLITAPYQTARILAWTNQLDTSNLNAKNVLNDGNGLWILQFETPSEAKEAVQVLQARGTTAEPDAYIPPIETETSSAISSSRDTYSWGVSDCKFDSFIQNNQSSLTQSGTVAVIDTGVDSSHSFLKGRVLSGKDFVSGDNDASDEHYHGTHVAGTILDCVGDTSVKILPVRVLDKNGQGYSSTIAAGIRYAADQKADVLNLSLGGTRGSSSSDSIDLALQYAISKGTTAVVAAGNETRDTSKCCPAHVTDAGVVVVSAGDSKHHKAYFTNYGKSVDLMAPGVSIKAATPGNSYKTLNGTSMAAPHAAAAAMLLDLASGKTLNPAEIEKKVRTATTNSGSWKDPYQGCGFLDLSKADIDPTPVPTPTPDPDPTPTPAPTPTVASYRYNTSNLSMEVDGTANITVTAVYTDNSTKDVTSTCGLYSTNPSVVSVDKNGNVTALAAGTAKISMGTTPSGLKLPTPISVNVKAKSEPTPTPTPTPAPAPTVASYRYNTSNLSMEVDGTANITVTAVYTDDSTKDVTSTCGLYSTNPSVVSVDKNGNVTALAAGTAKISMGTTASGLKLPTPISVSVKAKPEPKPIPTPEPTPTPTPTPDTPDNTQYTRLYWGVARLGDTDSRIAISKGMTLQIDVYGDTTDGRTIKLTKDCEIYSSDDSVISISSSGKLTANRDGEAYLFISSAPNTGLSLPPILEFVVE